MKSYLCLTSLHFFWLKQQAPKNHYQVPRVSHNSHNMSWPLHTLHTTFSDQVLETPSLKLEPVMALLCRGVVDFGSIYVAALILTCDLANDEVRRRETRTIWYINILYIYVCVYVYKYRYIYVQSWMVMFHQHLALNRFGVYAPADSETQEERWIIPPQSLHQIFMLATVAFWCLWTNWHLASWRVRHVAGNHGNLFASAMQTCTHI
jgi:hypothetical protein